MSIVQPATRSNVIHRYSTMVTVLTQMCINLIRSVYADWPFVLAVPMLFSNLEID